jgi:hypothetical protein
MSSIIVKTAVVKSACNNAISEIGKRRKIYRAKQIADRMDTTFGYLWWKQKPTLEEAVSYVDGGMCAKMDYWEFLEFQFNYWAEKWEGVISTSNRLLNMCKLADKIELSSEDAAFVGRWIDINSLS